MKSIFYLLITFIFWGQSIPTNNVKPYPDNSLYVKQYQELGMPSPDEVWNGSEFKRAVKVIKSYYTVDKWSIPRKNSEYSGALFNRILNVENFKIILDKSVPLQERLKEHDEILNGINQLLNIYFEPTEKEQRFGAEVLSLLAFTSQSTKYSVGVISELQALMSNRGIRNSDLDLMHDKLIAGVATTIEEHFSLIEKDFEQYPTKDIEQFAVNISNWVLDIHDYLSEVQFQEILLQTQTIAENHSNEEIKKQFQLLHQKLSKL